jgi:hypothetical protein
LVLNLVLEGDFFNFEGKEFSAVCSISFQDTHNAVGRIKHKGRYSIAHKSPKFCSFIDCKQCTAQASIKASLRHANAFIELRSIAPLRRGPQPVCAHNLAQGDAAA